MPDAIKQYVNLEPDKANELKDLAPERAGRNIKLVAKLNKPVAGVPVVFELIAGQKNSYLHVQNYSQKHLAYIRKKLYGLDFTGRAKRRVVTDDNGEATVEFILSAFGGDEFEVKAYVPKRGGQKGKELITEKYVTWRRIYYQVSRFQAGKLGACQKGSLPEIPHIDWASVEKEFKAESRKHHIELVREDHKDLIRRYANVLDTNLNEQELKLAALDGYKPERKSVTMRCVLVNMIAEQGQKEHETEVTANRLPISIQTKKGATLWSDRSLHRGEDCVLVAKWLFADGKDTQWKNFNPRLFEGVGPNTLVLHLEEIPDNLYKPVLGDRPVKIILALKLRTLAGSTNGLSWYNGIWIANENMHAGKRPEAQKQATTIHEAGHFIGMVSDLQKTYYEHRDRRGGHVGPHCSTGLSAQELKLPVYSGLNGTCVMFGESAASRKPIFCSECDKSVHEAAVRVAHNMPLNPANWDSAAG